MIYRECAHYLDIKPTNLVIQKDGKAISPEATTTRSAGIRNGDVLIVEGKDPTFNTDSRFKQLRIHQLKDENVATLEVRMRPTQHVRDIYKAWSSFIGYEMSSRCRRGRRQLGERN